ncbi:hypothetical protein [Demequina muriae]|uniref:Uncharacterized protein n=1 Tax=Demequina muriae TaxID=3051664 RepID=A0ABT8GDH4_9MICO|nr:hypothetical protein [Demequina sp. EGI L300058]MDN4479482.1 hypothetical protein [Demequina sp. EGI L300058]
MEHPDQWDSREIETTDSTAPAETVPARPRRTRRAARAIAWTVAGAGVAALTGLSGYLWITQSQWQDQNDELRAEALELGAQLATATAELESTAAELSTAQSHLIVAKEKVSTLADQDANATDDLTYAEDMVEQFRSCADEREELIGYLKQSSRYTASSLREAERSIDEFCDGLDSAWTEHLDAQE